LSERSDRPAWLTLADWKLAAGVYEGSKQTVLNRELSTEKDPFQTVRLRSQVQPFLRHWLFAVQDLYHKDAEPTHPNFHAGEISSLKIQGVRGDKWAKK
jgi:hypothetical protein